MSDRTETPGTVSASAGWRPLAGRSVLVTGGNGGIGLGMASALGAAGARLVLWGRNAEKNENALARLRDEGTVADAFVCDVSDEDQIIATFRHSVEIVGGRIDAVFANAGYSSAARPFVDLTMDEWRRTMAVNLDGVFLTTREAARHMVDTGGGALILVSSTTAIFGAATNEAYGASKAALLGLTRALSVGLARHKVRVNALVPGWTTTELTSPLREHDGFVDATVRRTPVKRWAHPDEYGAAAVFLADPGNTFHTGDSVVVDGGYTIA